MKMDADKATIELRGAQLLRLCDAVGVRVICRGGSAWVTQEGLARDDFLKPGETLTIEKPGVTLIQAVDRAMIAVEQPVRRTAVPFLKTPDASSRVVHSQATWAGSAAARSD